MKQRPGYLPVILAIFIVVQFYLYLFNNYSAAAACRRNFPQDRDDSMRTHRDGSYLHVVPMLTGNFSESQRTLRIQPFYRRATHNYSKEFLHIVTILSPERLPQLIELAEDFQGPISAAIQIPEEGTERNNLLTRLKSLSGFSRWVDLHLVFSPEARPFFINLLRNVAFRYCRGTLVFLLDLEFRLPLQFHRLHEDDFSDIRNALWQGHALVVPPFEFQGSGCDGVEYLCENGKPIDRKELLKMRDFGRIKLFHEGWPMGQSSVDYVRFLSEGTTRAYYIDWKDIAFEPFMIFDKMSLVGDEPLCDERFVDRGGNKVACGLQLYARGARFLVDPRLFIVHEQASRSPALPFMTDVTAFFGEWVKDLAKTYGCQVSVEYVKLGGLEPPACIPAVDLSPDFA